MIDLSIFLIFVLLGIVMVQFWMIRVKNDQIDNLKERLTNARKQTAQQKNNPKRRGIWGWR